MAEKKFKSLEELDQALEEEFNFDGEEEELEEEDFGFEKEMAEVDDVVVDDEEDKDEDVEPEEDSAPSVEEPTSPKPSKEEFAFGKLRYENTELKQKLEEQEKYSRKMEEMARNLGYTTADDLISAYEDQQIQKEAQQKNVDPEVYRKMVNMERELESIKQREAEAKRQMGVQRFSQSLDRIASDIGLDETEKASMINQMEADGYTLEDIARIKNPERFIKGYAADKIAERKYQELLASEKKAKKLKEPKLRGESEPPTDWEKELEKELEQYAKENNLYRS
jgi:hypothetical protein